MLYMYMYMYYMFVLYNIIKYICILSCVSCKFSVEPENCRI